MKRRTFIQNSLMAVGGLALMSNRFPATENIKLAFLRGGDPKGMLQLGLEELGGIGQFVRPGQKVLIKPTLRWNQTPETGLNTNPGLLAHLTKLCYEAGSPGVYLVDQTTDQWTKCYKNSGIERVVKDAGAKILPGNKEFLYQEVTIPNAQVMKTAKVHEIVQEVDLIINVPAINPILADGYFGAFQNLMGLVWNANQSKGYPDQSMVDFLHYKKPVLNIIDAYQVAGLNSIKNYKTLILSSDIIAAEMVGAKRVGYDSQKLSYLELAEQAGFGQMNLPKENIRSLVLKNSQQ